MSVPLIIAGLGAICVGLWARRGASYSPNAARTRTEAEFLRKHVSPAAAVRFDQLVDSDPFVQRAVADPVVGEIVALHLQYLCTWPDASKNGAQTARASAVGRRLQAGDAFVVNELARKVLRESPLDTYEVVRALANGWGGFAVTPSDRYAAGRGRLFERSQGVADRSKYVIEAELDAAGRLRDRWRVVRRDATLTRRLEGT